MDRLLYPFTLVVLLVWKFALSKEDFLSYFLTRSNLWESPRQSRGFTSMNYPNLAFEEMDASDAYWGAKIVTAFDDELVSALVSAGQYSRPEVRAYLERVFRERRDKIGRYWFGVVSPLEDFELHPSGGELVLRFRDLGVEREYARPEDRTYTCALEEPSRLGRISSVSSVDVPEIPITRDAARAGPPTDRFDRTPMLVVEVSVAGGPLPVRVVIGCDAGGDELKVLGLEHAPR